MSKEWILKTFIAMGFSKEEAEIYFLLSKNGPKKTKDIADELKMNKRKVYRILKKLQETNEVSLIEEKKPKILANWKSVIMKTDFDAVGDSKS